MNRSPILHRQANASGSTGFSSATRAAEATPAALAVRGLYCAYDGPPVVEEVTFQLQAGQMGCLLGPSGCGKTTLLRALAGLEPIARGEIRLSGQVCAAPQIHWAPAQRQVGVVFQDLALFPHLTVAEHVAFGLFRLGVTARRARVAAVLELVGLSKLAKRLPHTLSGGQQQRVALARALAPKPSVLLLDEPFSALDSGVRVQLADDVRRILQADAQTALLVTHDQQEAFRFADEIGVLLQHRLRQWSTPRMLYECPVDPEVGSFIGDGNWLSGQWRADGQVETLLGVVRPQLPTVSPRAVGQRVQVLLRPEMVHFRGDRQNARIVERIFLGSRTRYKAQLENSAEVWIEAPSYPDQVIGGCVGLGVEAVAVAVFSEAAGG